MSPVAATSALALSAAVIWGAGDFSGGMAARHLRVFWLVAISHTFSLICLVLLVIGFHDPLPDIHTLVWGVIAGVTGGVALFAFYHALSLGEMGVTAAISGLLTAALPVLFTMVTVGAPSGRQLSGFFLAAIAIWLISSHGHKRAAPEGMSPSEEKASRKAQRVKLGLAVLSGLGFGTFLITIREANAGGVLWPLACARIGSIPLAVTFGLLFSRGQFAAAPTTAQTVEPKRPGVTTASAKTSSVKTASVKTGIALALLAGVLDTSGNLFFIAATRAGRLDVAAVLSSLYPATTILLAAWLLRERTSRVQALGMAAALGAVALIS